MKRQLESFMSEKLRTKCEEVPEGNTEIGQDLLDSYDGTNLIGLAAPQVGLMYRACICLIDNEPTLMYNPTWTPMNEDKIVSTEACASLPNVICKVKRNSCVRVIYKDKDWKEVNNIVFGMNAIVVQHECDHLDGILMTKVAIDKTYKKQGRGRRW